MEDGNKTIEAVSGKRRLWIVGLVALVVVVLVAAAVWPGPREPEYQGKKLSEWLEGQLEYPRGCAEAVQAIGTNGVPFLLRSLEYRYSPWKLGVFRFYQKHPGVPGASYVK